ncbi:myofilin isoform X2 [Lasioglossum baleicum]|uniref:myofilin isoform X2 n=1 Tax=Lasioglossum baleicum TaxID=434251 RepID=UPI003FCDE207
MDARFRSNLDMIGRNEPITRKAKFWQSYVRALKGTDDIRAPEHTHRPRGIFRSEYPELSTSWPFGKSIFENPIHAADRINVPGYRYLPVHREIYGYSPRQIYPHQYKPVERFTPAKPFDPEKAWTDHLNRLADIDRMYPSKTPLLKRHISPPLSTKRLFDIYGEYERSLPQLLEPVRRILTLEQSEKDEPRNLLDDTSLIPSLLPSLLLRKKPLFDLLDPSPMAPISAFTRDPWWYPSYAPYIPGYAQRSTPFYLRDSYLSPVKRSYLWSRHPIRPLAHVY